MTVCFGAACGAAPPGPAAVGAGLNVVRDPPITAAPAVADAPAALSEHLPVAPKRSRAARASYPVPVSGGRIIIPKIGVDLAVYEGVDPWTLRFGPGHWEGTVDPGQVGNTVFAGHRTTFTHPFRDIDQIEDGDEVIFATAAGVFTYRASDSFIVDDTATWIADATDTPTFTLFACHPKGSERERFVVKGELVRAEARADQPAPPVEQQSPPPPSSQRRCVLCGGVKRA